MKISKKYICLSKILRSEKNHSFKITCKSARASLCVLLTASILACNFLLPASAYHDDPISADSSTLASVKYEPLLTDLPSDDVLFNGYVNEIFGIENEQLKDNEKKLPNTSGRKTYDDITEAIITLLVSRITKIANGEETKACFVFSDKDIKQYLPSNIDISSYDFAANYKTIVQALRYDCVYELYWYDKTFDPGDNDDLLIHYRSDNSYFSIPFIVSANYSKTGEEGTLETDPQKTAAAKKAVGNARSVLESANAFQYDYEVLDYFKNWICNETDYNWSAYYNNPPYGDPWQMINVFDGDSNTMVVCEGYAKAFKYLCDNFNFRNDVSCIVASGKFQNGKTSGGHMWNIVSVNKKPYIVDVTNIDNKFPLFMVGSSDTQYLSNGCMKKITIPSSKGDVIYTYHDEMFSLFGKDEINISTENCQTFSVTWKNANDEILKTDKMVMYGEKPLYYNTAPICPEYPDDHQFCGWKKPDGTMLTENDVVTSDITLTAYFEYIGDLHSIVYQCDDNWSTTYTGEPIVPDALKISQPANAKIRYSYSEDGQYDLSDLPQYINAGNYTVWFEISAEHYITVRDKYSFTIEKSDNEWITLSYINDLVYGQVLDTPAVAARSGDTVVFSYTNSSGEVLDDIPSEVGSYTLTATVYETDNYNSLSSTFPFKIIPADMELNLPNDINVEYDGKAHFIETVDLSAYENAVIRYGENEDQIDMTAPPEYIDSGIYTTFYKISAANYNDIIRSCNITIGKGENEWIQQPSIDSWVYGQAHNATTASSKFGDVKFSYSNNEVDFTDEIPTEVGSYYMKAQSDGCDNYTSLTAIVAFDIIPAEIILSDTDNEELSYNGEPHTPHSISVKTPIDTKILYGTQSDNCNSVTPPSFTDAGSYTIYYSVSCPNYRTSNGSYNFMINKAENAWTELPQIANWVEGEDASIPHSRSLFGNATYSFCDSEGEFTSTIPTSAGVYTMKAVVEETDNYKGLESIVMFTIEHKEDVINESDSDISSQSDTESDVSPVETYDIPATDTDKYADTSSDYTEGTNSDLAAETDSDIHVKPDTDSSENDHSDISSNPDTTDSDIVNTDSNNDTQNNEPEKKAGDVDNDDVLSSNDALLVLRSTVMMGDLTEEQQRLADINGDGVVDSSDALLILRISLGFE